MSLLLLALSASAIPPSIGADEIVVTAPFPITGTRRVSDPELAEMRGGMVLPNGFDVAVGIDIQTRVDGMLLLHTIYTSAGPQVGTRIFTDGTNPVRYAPNTVEVTTPASSGAPTIIADRSPTGTTIWATVAQPTATVNLVNDVQSTWLTAEGQAEVPVQQDGPAITAGPGTFTLKTGDNGAVAVLDTGSLQIQHLVGQATGAVIANTQNDRAIDTISSVSIDLQGISPALMGAIFTASRVAVEAVRGQ